MSERLWLHVCERTTSMPSGLQDSDFWAWITQHKSWSSRPTYWQWKLLTLLLIENTAWDMSVCPGQPQWCLSPIDASDREAQGCFIPLFHPAGSADHSNKRHVLKTFEKVGDGVWTPQESIAERPPEAEACLKPSSKTDPKNINLLSSASLPWLQPSSSIQKFITVIYYC